MSIKLRGKYVGIVSVKTNDKSFLALPDDSNTAGTILYIGDEVKSDLKIGQVVHFGNQKSTIKVGGKEITLMEDSNIVAIVEG